MGTLLAASEEVCVQFCIMTQVVPMIAMSAPDVSGTSCPKVQSQDGTPYSKMVMTQDVSVYGMSLAIEGFAPGEPPAKADDDSMDKASKDKKEKKTKKARSGSKKGKSGADAE